MEEIKREEIILLYDIYNSLLTDKQRIYFEEYYYSDLSLKEISENHDVSRNAIHDQLKRTIESLFEYENKLKLKHKLSKIQDLNINEDEKKAILDILWEE